MNYKFNREIIFILFISYIRRNRYNKTEYNKTVVLSWIF